MDFTTSDVTMTLEELNTFEDSLIERFNNYQILKYLNKATDTEIKKILLQRRFLSLIFTPVYDVAIDSLLNPEAIAVGRKILREEYPPQSPSHREELVHDLRLVGIEKRDIIESTPTLATEEVIRKTFSLLRPLSPCPLSDIQLVTTLRFWGEVLVAEEYRHYVVRLKSLGLTESNSRFFWPHYKHDAKQAPLNERVNLNTHSDQLTVILQKLLDTEEKIYFCAEMTERVSEVKSNFYDQFST